MTAGQIWRRYQELEDEREEKREAREARSTLLTAY